MSSKFKEKLRQLRVERKLTLEQLAEQVGSVKGYIWQLENKANAKPSAALLLKLADALGVAPDFLLDDSISEQSESQLDGALFRKIQRLSETDKKQIDRIIETFPRKHEN